MNYELASTLKKAGFPQLNSECSGWYAPDNVFYRIIGKEFVSINAARSNQLHLFVSLGNENGFCYSPTLSELIEACGEGFESLTKRSQDYIAHSRERFEIIKGVGEPLMRFGSTPEEAVANLWLVLNKNGKS